MITRIVYVAIAGDEGVIAGTGEDATRLMVVPADNVIDTHCVPDLADNLGAVLGVPVHKLRPTPDQVTALNAAAANGAWTWDEVQTWALDQVRVRLDGLEL